MITAAVGEPWVRGTAEQGGAVDRGISRRVNVHVPCLGKAWPLLPSCNRVFDCIKMADPTDVE